MKKRASLIFLLIFATTSFAQQPHWVNDDERYVSYPNEHFLTGFSMNIGNNTINFVESLKASAKTELIESIQVSIQSEKVNYKSDINGIFNETFTSTTLSFANADINGLKIEYHYDKNTQTGYAFAYVDKMVIREYYRAKISFIIQKIEHAINGAQQIESNGSKGQAQKKYKETYLFFADLHVAQSLLIAIGSEEESMQITKTLTLKSGIEQALSRMKTAIAIHFKSHERNFGQEVNLLEPKLKALLADHGCSYTNNRENADWLVIIKAATRKGNQVEGLFFSYLDVNLSLIEQRTGKEVYNNNFTGLKGGGLDYESAGLKAYDNGMQQIANELILNIEK